MTIEALDFKGSWNVAQVVEVDYEENEILVHYDNNPSKYDEWISMTSKRLRPIEGAVKLEIKEEPPWSIEAQILPESTLSPGGIGAEAIDGHTFIEGERCLASWIDSRKFPATVTKVIDSGLFFNNNSNNF